jgi:cyclase
MLKRRIIPVQLLQAGRLVKTVGFGSWRDVGDPVKSSRVYADQQADELVFLDITRDGRHPDHLLQLLERVSAVCFMPLALGGGITTPAQAAALIRHGADKVVVNSACYDDPGLITAIANDFGSQAIVASVDARAEGPGRWSLWSDCGRRRHELPLAEHLARLEAAGAGEILINSIDRDGAMGGYDLDLLAAAASAVHIPVIGCGGAGHYEHLRAAFAIPGIDALAMGSLFNFTDSNPIRAKAFLSNHGLPFKKV